MIARRLSNPFVPRVAMRRAAGVIAMVGAVLMMMVGSVAAATKDGPTPRRPNIIFILADDLGWRDLGCFGSEHFRSPQLDRLAAGGMRFTDAYAASCVCSPTRSSIMTGKYPARNDLTIWLGGRGGAPAVSEMALEEFTLAEALKQAGYATAMVGKWHLGNPSHWPKEQGFDIAIGPPHTGTPAGGYYLPNRIKLPGAKKGDYLTDRLTDEAIKIIDDHVAAHGPKQSEPGDRKPLFLYQAYHSVHTPIQGRPDLVKEEQQRASEAGVKYNAHYAAMVRSLDAGVGRIMERLKHHGLHEETIVIFTSDNGGFAYSGGRKNNVTNNAPLRRGKGYNYEGGNRVATIVHYPRVVKAGGVCPEPIISTDYYPTLLKLAGGKPLPKQHADGVDLAPLLRDPKAKLDRDAIYWHYPHDSPQGGRPSGAIRMGDWKLVEHFADHRKPEATVELFNLRNDIGESKDLARSQPDRAKQLRDMLAAWRKRVDAKMPPMTAPQKGKPRKPSRAKGGQDGHSSAGDVKPVKSMEGFANITNAELRETKDGQRVGYEMASHGSGLALRKLDRPIGAKRGQGQGAANSKAMVTLTVQSGNGSPSNAFLVLGDSEKDSETVKCGLFVGGNMVSIFEGVYPGDAGSRSDAKVELRGGQAVDVKVMVDLSAQTLTMQVKGKTVTHKLKRPIKSLRYVGYQVIRTRSRFGVIELTPGE